MTTATEDAEHGLTTRCATIRASARESMATMEKFFAAECRADRRVLPRRWPALTGRPALRDGQRRQRRATRSTSPSSSSTRSSRSGARCRRSRSAPTPRSMTAIGNDGDFAMVFDAQLGLLARGRACSASRRGATPRTCSRDARVASSARDGRVRRPRRRAACRSRGARVRRAELVASTASRKCTRCCCICCGTRSSRAEEEY